MDNSIDVYTLPALLRIAVGGDRQAPAVPDWSGLVRLARLHRVEPLIWRAVSQAGLDIPGETGERLRRAYNQAVFQDVQQDYIAGQLREAFCQREVPHILLRGAVLKRDYPEACLRTMLDLDYLVRLEDYPKIRQVADALGGQHTHTDGGHFTFSFSPQVTVEFHPNLIYTASPVGTGINPGWQYVKPGSGPYALELTEEGFYLNMVCHLAYHFAKGGTGIRSVLDLWVYRHSHTPQPDWEFVNRELERAGLRDFAETAAALSEAWFGDGALTPVLVEMGDYILTSGAYGLEPRAVLNAACFSPGCTGRCALMQRVFYPRQELENRFHWARGRSWLLPAAWCLRAYRAVTRHSGHILRWGRIARELTARDLKEQRDALRRFGFHIRERE